MSFIANYEFTDEQNSHFLRQILHFISTHQIAPTPINYALSYEYVSGSNKRLIVAVNVLIKEQKKIDNEIAAKLYNKFIYDVSYDSFDKVNHSLESLINNTRDSVAATSQKASDAGVVFEEQAVSIASVKNTGDLKSNVRNCQRGKRTGRCK